MSATEPTQPAPTDMSAEQADVQRDIEEAREELGGIAEALAQRANLRVQAEQKIALLKEQARTRGNKARAAAVETYRARPTYVAAGAGAAVALIIGAIAGTVWWRRR
jgi:hypothetical protein